MTPVPTVGRLNEGGGGGIVLIETSDASCRSFIPSRFPIYLTSVPSVPGQTNIAVCRFVDKPVRLFLRRSFLLYA